MLVDGGLEVFPPPRQYSDAWNAVPLAASRWARGKRSLTEDKRRRAGRITNPWMWGVPLDPTSSEKMRYLAVGPYSLRHW